MLTDTNKGITAIVYNHLNLPTQVRFAADKYIDYIYDATGIKLEKVVTEGTSITRTKYAGNYVYENNVLKFFNQPEGYVEPTGDVNKPFQYVYQYLDHLGNIRLSYSDSDGNGQITVNEIIEENNFYPFGLKHKGYNANINGVDHKFEYNGVEMEESLGLNLMEMDFRQYDPAIARFTGIDPVTHHSMSTYTAFDNNPIYWADPSGAYSTREWMKDNGITDDDLVTIYQAPEDDKSDEDQEDNPKVYIYGNSVKKSDFKNASFFDISDNKELISSVLGLFPNQGSDPDELRNALISSVSAILGAVLKTGSKINASNIARGGLTLDILPPTMIMSEMVNDNKAMDRLVEYEESQENPINALNYSNNNNLLIIFSEVDLFKNKKHNSTNNADITKFPLDIIEKVNSNYSKVNYIYMGINLGGGNISIINKNKI